jgi:hypothetical protein
MNNDKSHLIVMLWGKRERERVNGKVRGRYKKGSYMKNFFVELAFYERKVPSW